MAGYRKPYIMILQSNKYQNPSSASNSDGLNGLETSGPWLEIWLLGLAFPTKKLEAWGSFSAYFSPDSSIPSETMDINGPSGCPRKDILLQHCHWAKLPSLVPLRRQWVMSKLKLGSWSPIRYHQLPCLDRKRLNKTWLHDPRRFGHCGLAWLPRRGICNPRWSSYIILIGSCKSHGWLGLHSHT